MRTGPKSGKRCTGKVPRAPLHLKRQYSDAEDPPIPANATSSQKRKIEKVHGHFSPQCSSLLRLKRSYEKAVLLMCVSESDWDVILGKKNNNQLNLYVNQLCSLHSIMKSKPTLPGKVITSPSS